MPSVRALTRLEERLEEADEVLSNLGHFGVAFSRATELVAQRRELMRRLRLWLRAVQELTHHCRIGQQGPRLPPLAPLDTRVFNVPRHQLWRHQQLATSLLSSIEALLDTLARHVPAAGDLVRRFEAWESLPRAETQPMERDILVPEDAQDREEVHLRRQEDRVWERQLRPSLRELSPLRNVASSSPDGTGMVHVGIVDLCVATIAAGWEALGKLVQR